MGIDNFGADLDDWIMCDSVLGLTTDLLPVVSNPKAQISPESKMKDKGKTPSIYNYRGQVAGLPSWTTKQTKPSEILKWSSETDYGICIQTRNVRGFDIDVDDQNKVDKIVEFINGYLHWLGLPCRSRPNSGKLLLAFRVKGNFAKRRVKVDGGVIELLANGQQFVAFGTHPSGVKYEWDWNGHDDFPELTEKNVNDLWEAITKEFGVEDATTGNATRKRGQNVTLHDETLEYLDVLSWGKDGQAFIECPFKEEHSMDSGETETAYFPKGTNGYAQGHFKCLHAHCAGRSDSDFMDALGIMAKLFDSVPVDAVKKEPLPLPGFHRNKAGEIFATADNIEKALKRPDMCGWQLRFDNFRDEIMKAPEDTAQWEPLIDEDYFDIKLRLERGSFQPIPGDLLRQALAYIARKNSFDSAIAWLESLPAWDGKARVHDFLPKYFGTTDNEYTRAVSRYIWTTLAGRVMQPGVKADMVPILEGDQGLQKSTGISSMVPSHDFFIELSFHESDDNLARRMRGKLIGEIAELHGMHTKELEGIKAFATRTHEHWIPKYKEFAVTFPRRLLLMATTNKKEILADETGNRRWLPVHVTMVDSEGIKQIRNQLWAEAKIIFEKDGVYWQAEQFAAEAHEEYSVVDIWQNTIVTWLDGEDIDGGKPRDREYLKTNDILREALLMESNKQEERHAKRIGRIMRSLDYYYANPREGDKRTRCWKKW